MGGRHVIAKGTYGDGLSWIHWALRDQPGIGDVLSMIRVTDQAGRMLHGTGVGGPPLEPDRLMNVRTSGSDEGPRALLARVHPRVRRMVLTTEDGRSMTVPLFDCADIPEVRFGCLLVPRDVRLRAVAALGDDGQELERFSLGFQQGQWESLNRFRFGADAVGSRPPAPAPRSRRSGPVGAGQSPAGPAGSPGQAAGRHPGRAAAEPVGRLARGAAAARG